MAVDKTFKTASQAIASFSFTDIAEGTGVQIFFGYTSELVGGVDEHLTTKSSIFSKKIETTFVQSADTNDVKRIDLDFDLSAFNFPKTIDGTGFFSTGMAISGAANAGLNFYLIVRIRKWDGTTETEIASAESNHINSSGTIKTIANMSIIIPKTHFASGETLRVTVEGWVQSRVTPAGTGTVAIGHDPKNGDATVLVPSTDAPRTTTQMVIHIPFRIEL